MKLVLVIIVWLLVLTALVFHYRKQIFQQKWVDQIVSWWVDWGIGFRDFWLGVIHAKDCVKFRNARRETWDAYSAGSSFGFVSSLTVLCIVILTFVFSFVWAV